MKKIIYTTISTLITFAGCKPVQINPNQLTVSILPQKFFIEKIAGKDFKINVMIPGGQSPATYEPVAEQIQNLSASSVYFKIGYIMFEQINTKSFSSINSKMKIIDTSKGIKLINGIEEDHHNNDRHNHSKGIDPHVWLSPSAVKIVTKNIYRELIKLKPKNTKQYKKNYETFLNEIDSLHKNLKKIFEKKIKTGKNKFIVFHPSWQYFARDYNLIQFSIEVEGKEPNPSQIKNIIDTAQKENIKIIFVQKQFPVEIASSIAKDIKGRIIHLDPLAENWIANMKKIAKILEKEM